MATEPLYLRTRAEDPVERELASDDEVVHRDKGVNRKSVFAAGALGLGVIGAGVGGVLNGEISSVALLVPVAVAMGLTFMGVARAVARTAVTRDEVRVHKGRTIALADITGCKIAPATIIAPSGVLITFTENGDTKTLWLVSDDPDTLVGVIERERSRVGARVRVEVAEESGGRLVEEEVAATGEQASEDQTM